MYKRQADTIHIADFVTERIDPTGMFGSPIGWQSPGSSLSQLDDAGDYSAELVSSVPTPDPGKVPELNPAAIAAAAAATAAAIGSAGYHAYENYQNYHKDGDGTPWFAPGPKAEPRYGSGAHESSTGSTYAPANPTTAPTTPPPTAEQKESSVRYVYTPYTLSLIHISEPTRPY